MTAAKVMACVESSSPLTRTLFLVRFICESKGTSRNWLTELAEQETRPVPAVTSAKVAGSKAPGARPYPAAAVMQT